MALNNDERYRLSKYLQELHAEIAMLKGENARLKEENAGLKEVTVGLSNTTPTGAAAAGGILPQRSNADKRPLDEEEK